MMRSMRRSTTPIAVLAAGNRLFEKAVAALGLAEEFCRLVLSEAFFSVGSAPSAATADELGVLLPEIERRLRLALPYEDAADVLARLRHLLLNWEE